MIYDLIGMEDFVVGSVRFRGERTRTCRKPFCFFKFYSVLVTLLMSVRGSYEFVVDLSFVFNLSDNEFVQR